MPLQRILRVAPRTAQTRSLASRTAQRRWLQGSPAKRREWARLPQKDENKAGPIQHPQSGVDIQGGESQGQRVGRNTQLAATLAESETSDLVTEVHIPDDPHGVIPPDHPALSLLGNSSLVIQRQMEMMNLMLGFEQANKYIIMDGQGQTLGYIAEQDHAIGRTMARQLFGTHRSFTTHIFDAQEREVLRIHRPFAYINSRIRIYDPVPEGGYSGTEESTALQGTSASSVANPGAVAQVSPLKLDEMRIIGEAQQQWAPLRRKYNLFTFRPLEISSELENAPGLQSGHHPPSDTTAPTESRVSDRAIEAGMAQFAHVDEPFLSWDFTLRDEHQSTIGSVNRNFVGFARELFTDTGVYALRMDSAAQTAAVESAYGKELASSEREATAMTLDQRAVMLATAVSIDFDYFSRHSHAGGGFMPMFWPMGGGAAEGGAAGAGAGAAGGVAGAEAGAGAGAGALGAAEGAGAMEGAAGAVGGAATRGVGTAAGGVAESGIAGAGTLAGYEAMQRGVYGSGSDSPNSSQANEPFQSDPSLSREQAENKPGNDDVWGEDSDPWGGGPGDGPPPSAGGEGGGGWLDSLTDFFSE